MKQITFIDIESEPNSGKILDVGSVKDNGISFHSTSIGEFTKYLSGTDFICGHNIIYHDMKYIHDAVNCAGISDSNIIDTLFLSPLFFPAKPYHALLKDDKLQTDELNNPLNDSIKAKDLFYDEIATFKNADEILKQIFFLLLKDTKEFGAFFRFLDYKSNYINAEILIREKFHSEICEVADITRMISEYPIELAYCLTLINAKNRYSITPPWVLKIFPKVERIMHLLRNEPCLRGCAYCDNALDIYKGLKRFFGFDAYRTYADEPLQEMAVKATVANKSILAIFPTGGGKSITFQVPALMSGENTKGLTVVISPLQSLMKDQVDNLEKVSITDAVTVNGLLDPIERAKSLERVEDGSACMLYISPESLRSKTIERLLLKRNIARFVIDEAHCFSSWGQDFRVDYLYIGEFIKIIQEKKNITDGIPVSCFTATAKPQVIEDIRNYFKENLSLELEIYSSNASRSNLHYKVFEKDSEEEKYNAIRNLLEEKNCPTIIYVSRTRKAFLLAERLVTDGYKAKPYHGKMDKVEKSANQSAFINGDVQIMVATSAFGMGVDKKDVGMVIHYEISDSLENYVQEAGRAGRDEKITADCFVLFNDNDLDKHFILLNQTKLRIQEIRQIWKAIKTITKLRSKVSMSALEIARIAGWDENIRDFETRVRTAIAALETSDFVKRGQNMPQIYADSILTRNAQEAIALINASAKFDTKQKVDATRIIRKLFTNMNTKDPDSEVAESRVDYISDLLGINKDEVINIVNILREENILAHAKDLTAFIRQKESTNRSLATLKTSWKIESFLLTIFEEEEKTYYLNQLNEQAEENGCESVTPDKIKNILNIWAIQKWIKRAPIGYSRKHMVVISLHPRKKLEETLAKQYDLAQFIVEFLYERSKTVKDNIESQKEEILVRFSVHELKDAYDARITLFNTKASINEIEETLFYLSRIDAIKIDGGFLVLYNPMSLERLEQDTKIQYKAEDFKKLNEFYENKTQQIHIVGEYAHKMLDDYKDALQFVEDYFHLNYDSFLIKYFKGSRRTEIKRNLTPAKFKQLFGELSPTQLKIINDNATKYIVVAAGPGSGKTRVLVHKLASLLLMEDVKHEQLLMITFSRAAATDFKKLLMRLIGNAANFIEIKTFHSYCFDLLGKVGSIEKSDVIIKNAIEKIKNGEVEASRITKSVLVIDEAQDMNEDEFGLVNALMEQNEDMRVIAVGDDDQNIYEFRGASSKYLERFIEEKNAVKHELIENYRSKNNLVDFTNQFVKRITHRLKDTPIVAKQTDNGKIKLVRYRGGSLITPLVNDIISTELTGTTCVLTRSNEEALHITGLLLQNAINAKLIQTNDGFNLYNLSEVRYFLSLLDLTDDVFVICEDVWQSAMRNLKNKFAKSPKLDLCLNIIKDFEAINPKNKYKSDWEVFIRESRLEDFFGENGETIFVSTIHKSKGREFDNVFLMLENYNPNTDLTKRELYVAMTRAKCNLSIHTNGNYLDTIKVEGLERINVTDVYSPPNHLVMHLTYKDVWLDYFANCQNLFYWLTSGDELIVDSSGCKNLKGQTVLKFSKLFLDKIEAMKQKNYVSKSAKINFIVYWKKEDEEEEIKIILPEICFDTLS